MLAGQVLRISRPTRPVPKFLWQSQREIRRCGETRLVPGGRTSLPENTETAPGNAQSSAEAWTLEPGHFHPRMNLQTDTSYEAALTVRLASTHGDEDRAGLHGLPTLSHSLRIQG